MSIAPTPRRTARVLLAAGIAAGLVLLVAILPVQAGLIAAAETFRSYGAVGAALFALLFVLCAIALVPASPFSLAAGLVYGAPGLALAWLCMMVAGTVSFTLARRLLARPVRARVERHRLGRAALRVVDEEGWRMVLLIRVSGLVPFGMQNYGFAVSRVSFAGFAAATAVGVLPSIAISAGLGIAGTAAAESDCADALRLGGAGLAVAASLGVIAVTVGKVRARLAA